MIEDRVLTVPEVAERLKVRAEAVRRWIRGGKLAAFMPGGEKTGWRVLESELVRFIQDSRKASA